MKTILLAAGLLLAAASTAGQPAASTQGQPAASTATQQPPPETSTIVVPIRASLAALGPELEARVPKTFDDSEELRGGFDVRYSVRRDPIALKMIGPSLHSTTTAHYALEACRGRFPCISCGFGEPRRQAQITLHSKLEWDASWRIRSTTRPLPVHYPKRCAVTWFDFDITQRLIAPVVNKQLAMAARTIDRNTPAVANVRTQAQQIWAALQTPSELAPRTWLVLEPTDVALTPITGSGLQVTSTLLLRAQTRVVVGDKPAPKTKPLPALRVAPAAGSGIRVPFDLELPYAEATRIASRALAGKTYKVSGRNLKIETIRVGAGPNGKLRVEAAIDYRGGVLRNYRGIIYLEGMPRFDGATSTVVIPDLDYTLAQKGNLFRRMAERAAHDTLRDRLREHARFPLGPQLVQLRNEITRALTRTLAPGVHLRGRADAIQPIGVTPRLNHMAVRVVVTGAAEVELKM